MGVSVFINHARTEVVRRIGATRDVDPELLRDDASGNSDFYWVPLAQRLAFACIDVDWGLLGPVSNKSPASVGVSPRRGIPFFARHGVWPRRDRRLC